MIVNYVKYSPQVLLHFLLKFCAWMSKNSRKLVHIFRIYWTTKNSEFRAKRHLVLMPIFMNYFSKTQSLQNVLKSFFASYVPDRYVRQIPVTDNSLVTKKLFRKFQLRQRKAKITSIYNCTRDFFTLIFYLYSTYAIFCNLELHFLNCRTRFMRKYFRSKY